VELNDVPPAATPQFAHWGVALLLVFVALACAVSAMRSGLPRLEELSHHQIVPVDFDLIRTVRSRTAQSEPTVVGYAFLIPKGSIPWRYDNSTNPSVSEPPIADLTRTYLFMHDAVALNDELKAKLGTLVGAPLHVWFFQGKIVALSFNNQSVIDVRDSHDGFAKDSRNWWVWSFCALLASIASAFWPRLLAAVARRKSF